MLRSLGYQDIEYIQNSEFCKLLMDKMENTELTVNEVSKKPDLIMSLGKAIVKNIVIT